MTKITYAGLGNMGLAIAPHLSKWASENGAQFAVWNRTQAKYDEVRPHLAANDQYAKELSELADADIVFLSVLNDAASQSVVQTLTDAGFKGIFVDQSSVQPNTSSANCETASKTGARYLAAPVFGRPDAAAAAQLIQVVAGNADAIKEVTPLLNTSARLTLNLGEEVFKANTLKLMGNAMILGVIELLGETFALGEATGIDSSVFQQFIEAFFPTASFKAYSKKIEGGNFDGKGGFRLEGGLKDANNILGVGASLGKPVPMPTIEIAKKNMERAVELGGKDMDWSSLSAVLREDAGLPPFKVEQKKSQL